MINRTYQEPQTFSFKQISYFAIAGLGISFMAMHFFKPQLEAVPTAVLSQSVPESAEQQPLIRRASAPVKQENQYGTDAYSRHSAANPKRRNYDDGEFDYKAYVANVEKQLKKLKRRPKSWKNTRR